MFRPYERSALSSYSVNRPLQKRELSDNAKVGAKSYSQNTVQTSSARLVQIFPDSDDVCKGDGGRCVVHKRKLRNKLLLFSDFWNGQTKFKIKSTTLHDKKVNINWNILQSGRNMLPNAKLLSILKEDGFWFFGGRRRCSHNLVTRGLSKAEIGRIQSTLMSVMRYIAKGSEFFTLCTEA